MLTPKEVKARARSLEEQNLRFRDYLDEHINPIELDAAFLRLHKEIFADYDCCKCTNCCREYFIIVENEAIGPIASFLCISDKAFITKYLMENNDQYTLLNRPCEFIEADGRCRIQVCKPSVCKDFPYTDKPGRLSEMYKILNFAETCPIVFEMLERLKAEYGFE